MNMSPLRPLVLVACLLATMAGSPDVGATDILVGNGTGGTTAHGNDGVGGIERSKRFLRVQPNTNGTTPSVSPGGATLPPPPPSTNDLQQGPSPERDDRAAPTLTTDDLETELVLAGGEPGAPVMLVLGTARLDRPFRGGTLVPRPDLVLTGLRLDDQGRLELPLPPLTEGTVLVLQAWVADPGAPTGLVGTNALATL